MERPEIIETLKHFPDRLEAELAGVPETVLRFRPSEDEWSIKEMMGHVGYAEGIWYRRLYSVWSLHDPVLMTFNSEAAKAAMDHAFEGSLAPILADLKAHRPQIVDLLAHAVDWTRTGIWLGEGRRSLKQLAEALVAHDADHIGQLQNLKAQAGTAVGR